MAAEDFFTAVYELTPHADRGETAETLARDLAVEQTVEVPPDVIQNDFISSEVVGQIQKLTEISSGRYLLEIKFNAGCTGGEVPQLLNVLFGNISIKDNMRLCDLRICESMKDMLPGARHGSEGIRQILGAQSYNRPLSCSALKPMGESPAVFAQMAHDFALGGVDLIKDDHGLANQSWAPFRERVKRVQNAVLEGSQRSGHKTVYLPNLIAPCDRIFEEAEFLVSQGIEGILISPMLTGLDTVRVLRQKYKFIIMGHPAFSGTNFHDRTHGMTPAVLLGTIFRYIGCDISVYPNYGGRFGFTRQECLDLASALRRSDQGISSLPCPAGGMTLEKTALMRADYGNDVVCLIGGALLKDRRRIAANTLMFTDSLKK